MPVPRARALLLVVAASVPAGCAGEAAGDHHEDGSEERLAQTALALSPTDPVSAAVAEACSTTSVKGLAVQLVEEIQCLRPGTMRSIEGAEGFELGAAVFPHLQAPAAEALLRARADRGTTMQINSALRTLPQQYLLYRWYQTGRCGISLAASPGKSNHEGALAVDIQDAQGWRPAMEKAGFKWLGPSDPVHFDYAAEGAIDLGGLSVRAFQRLWNRNHPEDPIAEDGDYGPETEERLARSPVGGFPKGADCNDAAPAPPPAAPAPDTGPPSQGLGPSGARSDGDGDGCAASPARATSGAGALALVALAVLARRARRRVSAR